MADAKRRVANLGAKRRTRRGENRYRQAAAGRDGNGRRSLGLNPRSPISAACVPDRPRCPRRHHRADTPVPLEPVGESSGPLFGQYLTVFRM